ncbi:MAG: hypothetical protein ACREKS_19200 [Candidatus Rokuibacteriota bacterium]
MLCAVYARRVQALLSTLVLFRLRPHGFALPELRPLLAALLGQDPSVMTSGRMTYDLRRLRPHGLIARQPGTYRYHVTAFGLHVALFFTRAYGRLLQPGLARVMPAAPPDDRTLRASFDKPEQAMDHWCAKAKLVA